MEKLINSVGLSWLYDQIKLDLINIYNLLKDNSRNNFEQQYKEIDLKICRIAKVFYLLEIPGGVFFINEFRLTLKYLTEYEINNTHKIIIVSDLIEQLLNYIEDIIQGFGDLPLFYVASIDQLRALRQEVLFSQCSYIVNSVRQYNISDFPSDYNDEQRAQIVKSLTYVAQNYTNADKNYEQLISNITILKALFKGTQHYLLWELLESYFLIKKNYQLSNNYVYQVLLPQILDGYNHLANNLDFEKIAKIIPNWIASLAFCLLYSSYFSILNKNLRHSITKMLNVPDKKSLNNYMLFAERMVDTDSCILLLDIASELDIVISGLQESKHKRRIDITSLINLLQKQIDSCVLTGTYEPLEYYYNTVQEISRYTITGGLISSDDLEIIENLVVSLTTDVEQSVVSGKKDDIYDHEDYATLANESLAEVNQDATNSLLKHQISELDDMINIIMAEQKLTVDFVIKHLKQICNIFNLVSFTIGQKIVGLYIKNLEENIRVTDTLSNSLRQNIIVFLKYLAEVLKAVHLKKDYSLHLKTLHNLIGDIALAGINNTNVENISNIDHSLSDASVNQKNIESVTNIEPSQTKSTTASSSLKQIFLEEFSENNEAIINLFNNLKSAPQDLSLLESLQREFHTIKGASRMVSFLVVGDWMHHLEELVNDSQSHIELLTKEHINILEKAYNKVNELLDAYKVNIIPSMPMLVEMQFSGQKEGNSDKPNTTINSIYVNNPELSVVNLLKTPEQDPTLIETTSNVSEQDKGSNPVRTIPLRENVRVGKQEIDNLLDLSCELVIGQHQMIQQNNNYNMTLTKLKKVTDLIESKVTQNANIASDIEQLRSIIRQMQEIKTNYNSIVDNDEQNVHDIFNSLVNLRMVPIKAFRERLEHLAYSIADDLNKKIKFTMTKTSGSIDRVILEQITPCLEHLIRNAIDHGIEQSQIRAATHKEPTGHLELNMYTKDQVVVIELIDDGAGLDFDRVKEIAVKAGIISKDVELNEHNILPIITAPKFSTQDSVSQISGRGIGLNVVKDTVSQLCGILEIETKKNKGTKFTIQLPYSMAKQSLLFIKIMDLYYAMPSLIIDEVKKIKSEDITVDANKDATYKNIKIYNLYDLLNFDKEYLHNFSSSYKTKDSYNLVIINYKETKVGVIVDVICEIREAVVRPLSPQLRKLSEFMGGTIYQDGRVVLILDIWNILSKLLTNNLTQIEKSHVVKTDLKEEVNKNFKTSMEQKIENIEDTNVAKKVNILMIEDSATVRHSIKNYLSTAHYHISEATDGEDGLLKIHQQQVDLVLLDIIMPKMNGIEFLRIIRKEPKFKNLPVIIMTSREEQAYKDIAMQLNVDVYLQKPYDQTKLLNAISHVLADH